MDIEKRTFGLKFGLKISVSLNNKALISKKTFNLLSVDNGNKSPEQSGAKIPARCIQMRYLRQK